MAEGLHAPPAHPEGLAAELPEPTPYLLRRPTVDEVRRRSLRTINVVRRRMAPVALAKVRGAPIDPVRAAVPLRKTFADLGATYVKLGQLVASAPGVFGDAIAAEFRSLLDQGRPVGFERVRAEIERATGRPLHDTFAEVDPDPIGRASIAVVHRATLLDGTTVAVKVLRPGIERTVATDLTLMRALVPRIAARISGTHVDAVPQMIDGLRTQLSEELDLRNEARVMDHFNRLLDEVDLPSIAVPRTYPELSSRRVLVMEYLDGTAIDDLRTIETFGVDPVPLVEDTVKAFFLTAVRYGVFHGDVHAGNLLLLRDGRIGVLDWGIVGRLRDENVQQLRAIIRAALGDESAWPEVTERIGGQIGPLIQAQLGVSEDQVAPIIRSVLEPMFTRPFGEVQLSSLLLGPEELRAGVGGVGGAGTADAGSLAAGFSADGFDRDMLLLAKQLLYFERYGQLYLRDLSLFSDRAFFEALVAEG
jgi:predicted unusual protein kinase regulating ubiquinone biosynthesis (AarF/ABC1/UbiB family)